MNNEFPAYRVQTSSGISPTRSQYLDRLGRVVRSEVASFLGTDVIRQDSFYDAQGRVDRVTQPYFENAGVQSFTFFNYDVRNRIINTIHPDTSSTGVTFTADDMNHTVSVAVNKLLKTADGTSVETPQTKISDFNLLGELIGTTDAFGTSEAITTTQSYDGSGLPLVTTVNGVQTADIDYDDAGYRTRITGPNIGDVDNLYTALGQIRSQTDNKMQETVFGYDLLGRLESRTDLDGTSTWTYDTATNGVGKPDTISGAEGETRTFSYDSLGRLVQTDTVMDSLTYTTSQTFNADGRVDTLTYPASVHYTLGLTLAYTYNLDGYLTQVVNDGTSHIYWEADDMNAAGQLTNMTFGNGISTQRYYDSATGYLTGIYSSIGIADIQDDAYTFDALGNLIQSQDLVQGLTEDFTYDALNRLTQSSFDDGSTTTDKDYTYDTLGNLLTKGRMAGTSYTGTYTYGESGAGPHAVTTVNLDSTNHSFTYDLNGNQTAGVNLLSGNDRELDWSSYNKPREIREGANIASPDVTLEFKYGADRARFKQINTQGATTKTTYYVDGIYEKQVQGSVTRHVHYIQAADTVAIYNSETDGSTDTEWVRYLHRDHLGSVAVITDESANVVEQMSSDPHGKRRNTDWSDAGSQLFGVETTRAYTGHEMLDDVSLVHMNGRVYDPEIGRFLSADPFIQAPTNSQSFNRYSYVFNNR